MEKSKREPISTDRKKCWGTSAKKRRHFPLKTQKSGREPTYRTTDGGKKRCQRLEKRAKPWRQTVVGGKGGTDQEGCLIWSGGEKRGKKVAFKLKAPLKRPLTRLKKKCPTRRGNKIESSPEESEPEKKKTKKTSSRYRKDCNNNNEGGAWVRRRPSSFLKVGATWGKGQSD